MILCNIKLKRSDGKIMEIKRDKRIEIKGQNTLFDILQSANL